jgi:rod shape-determining protein MreB
MSSIGVNVDIGSSETKIIVTGPTGVIHSQVLPVAGNTMDEAIAQYLQRKYKLRVGMKTAEVLKSELGKVSPSEIQHTVKVRARSSIHNALEIVFVSDRDVREALADAISTIINAVTTAVKSVPAEMSANVAARGIALKGEKSLPKIMEQALMNATGMVVRRV